MNRKLSKNPWSWVPSLYFAEGLPNVTVMTISLVLYKQLGLSNAEIAYYTSWFYLPWTIKPLWSPFIDIIKTKRWWIITMQLLLGAAFGGVAFTIPTDFWLQGTICFFWLMAFSSATHDIAADGFYMLGLDVLPFGDHLRTRLPCHGGGQPASDFQREHTLFVEFDFLRSRWIVHRPMALAQPCLAMPNIRP